MIMFRRVLVALLIAALPLVLAAPASTTLLSVRDSQVEQWIIKTMNVHFMGESTGIVGTKWPAGSEFNSTIDVQPRFLSQIPFPSLSPLLSSPSSPTNN
jgi:hypothetical protein